MHRRKVKVRLSRYSKPQPQNQTPLAHKFAASASVLLFGLLYGWLLAGAPQTREALRAIVEFFTRS